MPARRTCSRWSEGRGRAIGIASSSDHFDLWVYRREPVIEYLLLYTSAEKADRFFGGGRFWQIPTDRVREGETIEAAAERLAAGMGLDLVALWAAEHVYTIYNRRRREIAMIPVFAAEVAPGVDASLTWEHAEQGWFDAVEAGRRVRFRGLREGLASVREYVTEAAVPMPELRLR